MVRTCSFFENGTAEQFEFCHKLYPQVLKIKAQKRDENPQELLQVNDWYHNDLPEALKARGEDLYLVYDELLQIMKWKQARGKFYPELNIFLIPNQPEEVITETRKAFRKLPDLGQAVEALANLKGVGTTLASAILAAVRPDLAAFMSYEALKAIPEFDEIIYTSEQYLKFVQLIQAAVTRLNAPYAADGAEILPWSPHRVELALWTHHLVNELCPKLLEEMPSDD